MGGVAQAPNCSLPINCYPLPLSPSFFQVVLLDMQHVMVMDVSGLEVMEEQYKGLARAGKKLVLCGLSGQPLRMLSRAGFLDHVGRANICRGVEEAVDRAEHLLQWVVPPELIANNAVTFLEKAAPVSAVVPGRE